MSRLCGYERGFADEDDGGEQSRAGDIGARGGASEDADVEGRGGRGVWRKKGEKRHRSSSAS